MKIDFDLSKRYLVFFGIIVVFALMGGVLAVVFHNVSEINWQQQIQGNVSISESLVAQRWVSAAGLCIGLDCRTAWNQAGQWTTIGGAISYPGNVNIGGLCINGVCVTNVRSGTQNCPSGQHVSSIDFQSETIVCSGGSGGGGGGCTNACTTPGQWVCSSTTAFRVCFYNGATGCNELSSEITCTPAGTTCSNGACVGGGGGVCTPGQTQCVGTTGQQTCGSNSQWGGIISCSAGWACDSTYNSCRALQWTLMGQVSGGDCSPLYFSDYICPPQIVVNAQLSLAVFSPIGTQQWYVYDNNNPPQAAQIGSCTGTCTGGQYCLASMPSRLTYTTRNCDGINNVQLACGALGPNLYKCQ